MDIKKQLPHHQDSWEGYTLDELRYRRAYIAACKELEKEKLAHAVSSFKSNPATGAYSVARRVAQKAPLVNYGLLAFGIASKAWKIIGRFRGKKKKK